MNEFEYKKRYDPELGRYVKKHVHSGEIQAGGALTDIFKSVFGKTIKKAAKTTAKKALQTGATKTGEYIGKKAGDKITQLLRKNNEASQLFSQPSHFHNLHKSLYLHHKFQCHRMRLMRELTE